MYCPERYNKNNFLPVFRGIKKYCQIQKTVLIPFKLLKSLNEAFLVSYEANFLCHSGHVKAGQVKSRVNKAAEVEYSLLNAIQNGFDKTNYFVSLLNLSY